MDPTQFFAHATAAARANLAYVSGSERGSALRRALALAAPTQEGTPPEEENP